MANLILWNSLSNEHSNIRTMSCYQLAYWLRQYGYTVKVIDFCFHMSTPELVELTERHIGKDTLAIGVSSTFWHLPTTPRTFPEPKWVIRARRSLSDKKLSWLLGGPYSRGRNYIFDWVTFDGPAEDSLLKWMDENSRKLVRRDSFDITTSSILFSKDDFIQPYEVLPIELGRGYQFKCRFCSFSMIGKKKGTYIKDFSVVKEELIRNYNEYGVTRYCIMDDTVNESEEKIYALANIVQSLPFKFEWVGFNRLDLIWSRPDTVQALKDSGLKSTFFGIESFHPKGARAVGKGWNGKYAKDFLLKLKDKWREEITWAMGFIAGLPGEDKDSIEETHKWCKDNNMYNWWFSALVLDRDPLKTDKSEFELDYEKYGYSYEEGSFTKWKSDLWDRQSAVDYILELNKDGDRHRRVAGFALTMQSSLGYSFEELNGSYVKDLPYEELTKKTKDFVNNYVVNQRMC
jgi:hypothetical protein